MWLIDELNGVLDIQSELGQGSLFCVEIPLTIATEVEIGKATSEVIKAVYQPISGFSVLLIEDHAVYAEALLQKFKLLDVECHWAKSAQQAHRILSDATFDLIFLDTRLPDSPDGVIVNKLTEGRAVTLFPPTVIISGNVCGKTINKWMDQGANLILNKPIAMKEISQLLALYQQKHDFSIDENARSIDKAFLPNEIQILGAEQVYKLIIIYLDTTPS